VAFIPASYYLTPGFDSALYTHRRPQWLHQGFLVRTLWCNGYASGFVFGMSPAHISAGRPVIMQEVPLVTPRTFM